MSDYGKEELVVAELKALVRAVQVVCDE